MIKTLQRIARLTIRQCQWLTDEQYIKALYLIDTGRPLHLSHPRTFQEKIQWLKLYAHRQAYTAMVDKVAVKQYVARRLGHDIIIPLLGVWENYDDIDFSSLPDRFVLKTSHGGGNCGVVICNDKKTFDHAAAKAKLQKSLRSDIYRNYREWPYKNVPRRILAEQFIEMTGKNDLTDYKIFCFNGKPQFIQVIQDRNTRETIDFFDTQWQHQDFWGLNPNVRQASTPIPPPLNLDRMLRIARTLSDGIPFLRVDLYEADGHLYFGELTFYPASGYGSFYSHTSSAWDLRIGQMLKLPTDNS